MSTAAVYARVSTEEQAEHGTSLDTQLERCRIRAGELGATEIVEFVDDGVSGSLLDRPALNRLRALVSAGGCRFVVIWDPDRFARKLTWQLIVAEEIEAAGVQLDFVNFEWKNTPDGRLFFSLRGAIAEYEREKIRERSLDGRRAKARAGVLVSVPHGIYGYRYDRANRTLVVVPDEAEIVRAIYARALDDGTWRIAGWLNDRHIPSRTGRQWSQAAVRTILRNRTYCGQVEQMGGLGVHRAPPIVGEATWNEIQETLTNRLRHRPGHPKYPYLLTGRASCALCGWAMFGGYGNGQRQHYYVCSGKKRQPRCTSRFFRAEAVDGAVWTAVSRFLMEPRWIRDVLDDASGRNRLRRDAHTVQERLNRLDGERQRILRLVRRDVIDDDAAERQLREIKNEEQNLRERMADIDRALAADGRREETAARLEALLTQHSASAAALDITARRRILRMLDVKLVLGPSAWEVNLTLGGALTASPEPS